MVMGDNISCLERVGILGMLFGVWNFRLGMRENIRKTLGFFTDFSFLINHFGYDKKVVTVLGLGP